MKGYDPSTGLGYIQTGRYLEVTLPYARSGGQGVLVGDIFGICTVDGAQGEVINIDTECVYGLVAATGSGNDAAQGAAAYWDDTNKRITPQASTHKKVGNFVTAKTTTQAFASVKIG
jgi:predicted RecA/RadA family phage recombinase